MAVTNWYVRPVNGSDVTGDGTSHATAWQTLNHLQANYLRHSTGGDRINVCDEGTCALSAALIFASTQAGPTIIQGYTAVAEDGGIGVIDGAGSFGVLNNSSTAVNVALKDLNCGNCGAASIIRSLGANTRVENVYLHDTTGDALSTNSVVVANSRFENVGGRAISCAGCFVYGSWFLDHASDITLQSTNAIQSNGDVIAIGNIFVKRNDWAAIYSLGTASIVRQISNNSFFCTGNTATPTLTLTGLYYQIFDNLFEGSFIGIYLGAGTAAPSGSMVDGNSFFDCDTDITNASSAVLLYRNEALNATPFAKNGALTYSNRVSYFEPVNVGDVFSPICSSNSARGAVQVVPGGTELIADLLNMPMQDNAANTTVDDASPANNDGTLSASTTAAQRVDGPVTRVPFALDFATVSASISEITIEAFTPFSVSFWAKRPDTASLDFVLGHSSASSAIYFTPNASVLGVTDADGVDAPSVFSDIDTSQWHHYVLSNTGTGDDGWLYVDGLRVSDTVGVGELNFDLISKHGSTTGRLKLAKLKLYDYALTASQAIADYSESVA